MKNIFKSIVLVAATIFAVGCTPDYPTLDEGKLPLASELDVEIVVDQTTNMVTFTLKNEGMVPMWIFPETDKPDDNAQKKAFSVAINGYTARFRDAGTHSVEVKAYNVHGISQGSINKEFTLDNTYRDPFDQSKYMNAIAGEWMWNSTVDGHFGCGSAIETPTDWWPCPANGKDGMGMYDDRMIFSADGKYTFNPGEGGTVYVNWGANELYPDLWDGTETDYQVPMEEYTKDYRFENNWNAAGIEEIYLVLEEGANLSYIPHVEAVTTNTRYLVVENTPAQIRKKLNLVWYTATGNNGGPIAWKYEFIPAVKVVSPEEMLAGTDAAGKVWVMDNTAQGHLGCGEAVENAAGWWSAGPDEKTGTGLYDDEITFCPDGTYIYNPGPDGKLYINWGTTELGGAGVEPDVDIDWTVTESTYDFDGSTITLAAQTPLVYVPSNLVWNEPVFHVIEITESHMTLVAENPGCYWQYKFRARDYKEPESSIGGVAFEGGKAELSIAQGDVLSVTGIDLSTIYVDPDFFKQVDATSLKFTAVDGEYRIQKFDNWLKVVPLEGGDKATYDNGKALWIIGDGGGKPEGEANLIGWNTGEAPLPMARISENEYRITLWMKAEGGSIKIFGQSDWGVEWTKDLYGTITDNGYFNIPDDDGNIHTIDGATAGFYTFLVTDNGGILDLEIKKIASEPTELDATAESNLWTGASKTITYWFANNDWGQIADPTVDVDGSDYTVTCPDGIGASQWQGQMAIMTDIVTEESKNYDFQLKLYSDQAHPHVTVKLCNGAEGAADDPYYFDPQIELYENETTTVFYWNIVGKACNPVKLVLDFGGAAAGQTIEVTDIVLQEHSEWE